MTLWKPDSVLFAGARRELFVAAVGDVTLTPAGGGGLALVRRAAARALTKPERPGHRESSRPCQHQAAPSLRGGSRA